MSGGLRTFIDRRAPSFADGQKGATMRISSLVVVMAAATILGATAVAAQGQGQGQGQSQRGANKPERTEKHESAGKSEGAEGRARIDRKDRDVVRLWYGERAASGSCPPGLAKKGNGCLPPGQAKKLYAVGQPLASGILLQALPADLLPRLAPPPSGYRYGYVDGDVLLVALATNLVVDAIRAAAR